ncbi:hypothetical protein MNB_SV-12-841 [hydrothermal vent metagenome]|uniref:Uncharacterized protein n=1 Tax=hydrothermal vent metagenome TaxID=652676 RepID=A0A1W1CJE1_9ZZZZ
MIKVISVLLIGTLVTSNIFAVEAGDYCIGGKCYSKLKPRNIKKKKDILKVDDEYKLDVTMEMEKQRIDGKKPIIVDSGFDEDGEYTELVSYYKIPNELSEVEESVPKFFCPDKKTLHCDNISPTESDCKCV